MIKLLQQLGHRHHLWDVFGAFIELAALAINANIDITRKDAQEARYMQVIKAYSSEEARIFPQLLAHLVEALEAEPGDVLGAIFGELELGNTARGQFFTPYHLCRLMASLNIDDRLGADIAKRGFVTLSEPACGAGAMIIAFAEEMKTAGYIPSEHLHVTAVDVDARAVHMTYLQLSLLGIPAVVVHGNTLSLQEHSHWYTPVHFLNLWPQKLKRGYALGSAMDLDYLPITRPEPIHVPAPTIEQLEVAQLALF